MNQQALFELYLMMDANKRILTEDEIKLLSSAGTYLAMFCSVIQQIAGGRAAQKQETPA